MRRTRQIGLLLAAFLGLSVLAAQEDHGYTAADIERGGQIFLSNCANCHGPDGDGVPSFNLASGRFRHATTDSDLLKIIRNGIPGTPMPPGNYSEAQAGMIVAYLRSMSGLARARRGASVVGDSARGKALMEGKGQCLSCHRVNGRGAFLGPDLSEIGGARRLAELERSLLEPSAEIRLDNHTVRMVRRDGTAATARLLNQDSYLLQVIDATGKLLSVPKSTLREFEIMRMSPMPAYNDRLDTQELADVIGYLVTLKGSNR